VLDAELFRHVVTSICEEIEINITRTAYSPIVYEAQDYSVGLLTRDFRVFAQSGDSIPIFVAGLGEPVRDAVEIIGEAELEPGDVLVTNFSDVTGQHINNVIVASPIFDDRGIVAYLAIRMHWADLGGLLPGGQSFMSRSVLHDGTRYRGLRVMRAGRVVPEVLATLQANTWQPVALTGDLMAQLASCRLVARRWEERLMRRWGPDEVRTLIAAGLEASASFARSAVEALPDGVYPAERSWLFEEAGEALDLRLKLTVTVDGERICVDLSEMPPQTILPINSGAIGGALSALRVAFKLVVAPEWPVDDGLFSPLEVDVPEGTIMSAGPNAPVGHWNMLMPSVIDLFIRAIGQRHPELVPASHFCSSGGVLLRGTRADGTPWWHGEPVTGGLGASRDADGFGPVKSLIMGDFKSVPVEIIEARYPLLVHSHRLDRDAGGEGRHRGGPGTIRVTEVLADVGYDALPEQTEPAHGLAGGAPGKLGRVTIQLPGASRWEAPPRTRGDKHLPAGSLICHRSGGGGGWGMPDPAESGTRPPA
jgi:N-methylhydantoinase B